MRVGIVGAGAVGGYFGGRLAEKGVDVTFLVRARRKSQLEQTGLMIRSPYGDVKPSVSLIEVGEPGKPFDLIILSVKAYHLSQAIQDMKPYCHSETTILPLLNGYTHLVDLKEAFGSSAVLGGFCFIESTLNDQGEIIHMSKHQRLVYGELDEQWSQRMEQLEQLFAGVKFEATYSSQIHTDMWNKYQHISALSGMTAGMCSSLGPIIANPYGKEIYLRLLQEIHTVAQGQNCSVPPDEPKAIFARILRASPETTSSMLRDRQQGFPIENDHLQGRLVEMGEQLQLDIPVLKTIHSILSLYEPTS